MIIFINGSINSGKSTVAKLLSKKISNSALIEIDVFHEMIEWMSIDRAVPLNLENAISVVKNFSNNKINVIVPYPLSQKNYDYMIKSLSDLNEEIHTFTLAPSIEKVLMNRGSRELSEWEKERVKYHYDIGIHKPMFGEIIDNSNITPEQTAEIIISKIT